MSTAMFQAFYLSFYLSEDLVNTLYASRRNKVPTESERFLVKICCSPTRDFFFSFKI